MGFMDIFGGGGSADTQTGVNTVNTDFPDWYNRLNQANILRAGEASFEPYQAYQGPRLAQAGPGQLAARAGFGGIAGMAQPYFDEARTLARRGSESLAGKDVRPFMSPFQQAVTDVTLRQARTAGDQAKRERESQATMTGAFGGSRNALVQQQAESDLQQNLSDIQTRGSQSAYENAMAQLMGDRAAATDSSSQMMNIGTGLQNNLTSGLREAETAGVRERTDRQSALDMAYQDYLTQRAHPQMQAQGLSALLNSTNVPQSEVMQMYGQSPSSSGQAAGGFMSLLGLGATALGTMYGGPVGGAAAGAAVGALQQNKDGGEIRRYNQGGPIGYWHGGESYYGIAGGYGRDPLNFDTDVLYRQQTGQDISDSLVEDPNMTEDQQESFLSFLHASEDPQTAAVLAEDETRAFERLLASSAGPMSNDDFNDGTGISAILPITRRTGDIETAPEAEVEVEPEAELEAEAIEAFAKTDRKEGGGGFFDNVDWSSLGDILLNSGLGTMQAASQPGATMLGSIGAGAGSGLAMKREADRYDREEALANRQLDVQEANYAAQAAADFASMNYAAQQDMIENTLAQMEMLTDEISTAMEMGTSYSQEQINNLVEQRANLQIFLRSVGMDTPDFPSDLRLPPPDES